MTDSAPSRCLTGCWKSRKRGQTAPLLGARYHHRGIDRRSQGKYGGRHFGSGGPKSLSELLTNACGLSNLFRRAQAEKTLDGGAPVSPFTVGRALGHGGDALVRKVYGHLGTVRHRSAAVEYRMEQHAATLGDRVATLRGATS
jgi:hypothetical protein